jgi:hypothetical protein
VDKHVARADLPFVIENLEPGLMEVLGEDAHPLLIMVGVGYEYVSIVGHGCPPRLDRAWFNRSEYYLS